MEQETGIVKWFDSKKGYGFIERDFGGDIFVHYTSLKVEGFKKLEEGQRVQYEVGQKDKGIQAFNVIVIEEEDNGETPQEDNNEEETDEKNE